MSTIIKVEELSKYYRLGLVGGVTLREDFDRWIAQIRGKPDPLLSLDESVENRRNGEVWALQNINLEVKAGEILGVIGRNGAGKSTLLKILSRITAPTKGEVRIKGRVGSLLEVGTGFHPELTGRENIYLNGTILGMTKAEITRKLDDIVEFSGISKFIDTPVKRFSSGMTVRLAFSVAAHLEPEILIVDEVLAVGDAAFQRKCLGKMQDISGHGRTVLFVSHNMTAIESLCTRALLLDSGKLVDSGDTSKVIRKYLSGPRRDHEVHKQKWDDVDAAPGTSSIRVKSICAKPVSSKNGTSFIGTNDELSLDIEFWNIAKPKDLFVTLKLLTELDLVILTTSMAHHPNLSKQTVKPGLYKASCRIPKNFLNDEMYFVRLLFIEDGSVHFKLDNALSFKVHSTEKRFSSHMSKRQGVIAPTFDWSLEQLS